MALGTFTDIESSVVAWLNREGASDIAANVPDFIDLAQRRIQRDVRVPPMEVVETNISIVGNEFPIPTAMLEVKEVIAYDGSCSWPITRGTYATVKQEQLGSKLGPTVFDTVASNFIFGPGPTGGVSVDIVYYKEIEFISTAQDTNWFSMYAPETILYGALVEAAVYMKDTEQEAKYEEKFKGAIAALKSQKSNAEYSGRLQIKTS